MTPTKAQLDYAKDLMAKLGYEEDDLGVDLDHMNRAEVSELIEGLKKEWEG